MLSFFLALFQSISPRCIEGSASFFWTRRPPAFSCAPPARRGRDDLGVPLQFSEAAAHIAAGAKGAKGFGKAAFGAFGRDLSWALAGKLLCTFVFEGVGLVTY